MEEIIIIGAGAAGLCAAWELAKNHVHSVLVSDMPSERAQSNMAEGGINAAFLSDTDSPELHAEETLRAGRYLADAQAVHDLAENAPNIIEQLFSAGMSFSLNSDGRCSGVWWAICETNLLCRIKYRKAVDAYLD